MKQRIYIDTSVIGGCYDEEFKIWSNQLIEEVHVLASWNFKHIVNLDRIRKYNGANLKNGYQTIEIRTPREILKSDENEY